MSVSVTRKQMILTPRSTLLGKTIRVVIPTSWLRQPTMLAMIRFLAIGDMKVISWIIMKDKGITIPPQVKASQIVRATWINAPEISFKLISLLELTTAINFILVPPLGLQVLVTGKIADLMKLDL